DATKAGAYDPEKARSLLEQAGWTDANGDGVREKAGKPLNFTLSTSDAPERTAAARAVAAQLAKVGVKVEVTAQTWEDLRDTRLVPRDFAAALAETWLPSRDPDVLPFWHSNQADEGLNFSNWRSPAADALLTKGRQTWTSPAREAVYADFQSLFAAESPAVYLYYPTYTYAVRADVKGVRLDALLDPVDRLRTFGEWYLREARAFF
ncbi:MAG: ABC transporter substrate-binding protein, partial [Chloroflexota bacterium]